MSGDDAGSGDEVLAALVASLRGELAESQAALARTLGELAQARERIAELEARLRQTYLCRLFWLQGHGIDQAPRAGSEMAVGVMDLGAGPRALPPVEIVAPGRIYDYAARCTAGQTEFHVPARLPAATVEEAARVAVAAHVAVGLRDISRTDLIVDATGGMHFLEVNVAPGMTSTSTLPMAMRAAGIDLGACCATLLDRAAERAS